MRPLTPPRACAGRARGPGRNPSAGWYSAWRPRSPPRRSAGHPPPGAAARPSARASRGWLRLVGSTACQPSVVERSTVTASARPPALTISSATAPLRTGSTSTQRTLAPSRASASAMARPMLEAEPVTRAVSPLNRPIGVMGHLVREVGTDTASQHVSCRFAMRAEPEFACYLSSSGLSRGSSPPRTPERVDGWMAGTSPAMTKRSRALISCGTCRG